MLTQERIEQAVNEGADLVIADLDLGDRDMDLLGLAVVTIIDRTFTGKPEDGLDDVIRRNYQDVTPEDVRSWMD
ncbi:hypothetical protein ACFYXL_18335 [Streptomyces tsukubensis]|uniref:hypothetical protein n=1 Tax=Streptomyces tsukubensis TaxID=83656 RepID=UPI00368DCF12